MKKKVAFLFLFFCFLANISFSQEYEIKLEPECGVLSYDLWKDNGLLICTGRNVEKVNAGNFQNDPNLKLQLFSPDLAVKWEVPIKNQTGNYQALDGVIKTDNYVYYFSPKSKLKKSAGFSIKQVSKSGAIKDFETDKLQGARDLSSVYGSEGKVFFVLSNFNQTGLKSTYSILTLDEQSLSFNDIKVNLPVWKSESKSFTEYDKWTVCGFKEGSIYYFAKEIDLSKTIKKFNYKIAVVNLKGEVVSEYKIDALPEEGKYVGASINPFIGHGSAEIGYESRSRDAGPYPGNYGDIYFDTRSSKVYIFGFYNESPKVPNYKMMDMTFQKYTGFFIFKYDTIGKVIWKNYYPFSAELKGSNKQIENSYFMFKFTDLQVNSINHSIIFSFRNNVSDNSDKLKEYYFDIDKDGNLLNNSEKNGLVSNGTKKLREMIEKYQQDKDIVLGMEEDENYAFIYIENWKSKTLNLIRVSNKP